MIDGEAFLLLTQTDIVKIMSIKLGPALKISNAILMFKSTDEGLKWIPPSLSGSAVPPIIMCQIHSVAGKKTLTPFSMCSVSCTHQREGGGRGVGGVGVGGWGPIRVKRNRAEIRRFRLIRKYEYFWRVMEDCHGYEDGAHVGKQKLMGLVHPKPLKKYPLATVRLCVLC